MTQNVKKAEDLKKKNGFVTTFVTFQVLKMPVSRDHIQLFIISFSFF